MTLVRKALPYYVLLAVGLLLWHYLDAIFMLVFKLSEPLSKIIP